MHFTTRMTIAVALALLPLSAARATAVLPSGGTSSLSAPGRAGGGVVINEIFYNAPDDRTDVQWIELHNTGDEVVDISGWALDQGRIFLFPAGTRIDARGYLIVALQPEQFRKLYGLPALGPLKRPLARAGERIELRDAQQKPVDVARYKDREPWPVSADGYSASLERICPTAPGEAPENWTASPLPAPVPRPAGTPGKQNAAFSAVLPPVIGPVAATPEDLLPGQPLNIEATVALPGGISGSQGTHARHRSDREGTRPATGPRGGMGGPAPGRAGGEVNQSGALREVTLLYRVVVGGSEGEEAAIPMTRDETSGRYRASIPPQPAGVLVRYRIRAVSEAGAPRLSPAEHDLRPMFSAYVHERWQPAKIAFGLILRGGPDRPPAGQPEPVVHPSPGRPGGFGRFRIPAGEPRSDAPSGSFGIRTVAEGAPAARPRPGPPPGFDGPPPGFRPGFFGREVEDPPRPPRGSSTFVYVDPRSGKTTLFDYVSVLSRGRGPGWYRGYKIFLHKDRLLNGQSAVNLVMEGSEWSLMAEALAFDVYRRAGNAAPLTEFVRVWVDGRLSGYHLMVERPNRAFLRRNKLHDEGNLYKLLWYGGSVVGQHEKKTNPQSGHADLLAVLDLLRKSRGEAQWKVIQEHFNVNQVATYFAVNMVLSHWDGFFNNYYTYHDTRGTKKWEMYPWDQDKTWGFHDAVGEDEIFIDLPLTFGMAGAAPPGGGNRGFGGPFGGGAAWWRPPGHFSGPLLANPQFRRVFLARTKEILDKVYTQEIYFPLIDEMALSIREDVVLRAQARGEEAAAGARHLARNVEMLKTHLVKRREFLLQQPELRALGNPGAAGAALR